MKIEQGVKLALDLMKANKRRSWTLVLNMDIYNDSFCDHSTKSIGLSRLFIESNTKEDVRQSVLHALAHALCKPDAGHGDEWFAMCLKIGADPVTFRKDKKSPTNIVY